MDSVETDAAEVLKSALALPLDVRAALIDSLVSSLDQDRQLDPGAEEAWRNETVQRLHQIDSGAIDLIPWEEAHRRLRSRLQK